MAKKRCEMRRFLLGYRPQRVCAPAKSLAFLRFSCRTVKNTNQPFVVAEPFLNGYFNKYPFILFTFVYKRGIINK